MAKIDTLFLPAGYELTITADSSSSGNIVQLNSASNATNFQTISASSTTLLGPFNDGRQYRVTSLLGQITTSQAAAGFTDQDSVDIDGGTIDGVTLADSTITGSTLTTATITNPTLTLDAEPTTTSGVGAKNGGTVTVAETGNGIVHRTVLTLSSTPLSVVSVTTGNGVGGVKIYDFPQGYLNILGCTANLSLGVETQGDFTDGTPEGDLGIGTVSPANADALGTDATDDNIATATAFTMDTYTASGIHLPPDSAGLLLDGTATPVDLYVTALVDAVDINDDTTTNLLVSGTVTVVWTSAGDY